MYSDDDAAALYDLLCPWDTRRFPADRFYGELVMAAASVLDVGCGTGSMLHWARERGHTGRLAGVDPDRARLARARRREDVQWVAGTAADVGGTPSWRGAFALATMTSHAFQCLVTDDELRASLAAVRTALRPGEGRFAFETRHPQASAWQTWDPAHAEDVTDAAGRDLRTWNEVESVEGDVVTFSGVTVTRPAGTVLRTDHTCLRFLAPATLDAFLAGAGFAVEARYGDWDRSPVGPDSREIVTIARAV